MSIKNSPELKKSINCILEIYKRCVISTDHLMRAERLESWREGLRAIRKELESIRSIIDNMEVILHMLIGIEKYLHWSENIGTPQYPFPNWNNVLFPSLDLIEGHPWLLTVKKRSNVNHKKPTAPSLGQPGKSSSRDKGKGKEMLGQDMDITEHPSVPALDDEGESEVVGEVEEVDKLMDDDGEDLKPVHGWSTKRG
ncbi:hypothetical protein PISMIDRAFT_16011 [Pisolithus microcarpus 441]|uniref:Uncharacterized protein n=1 Tax=Pisolithus microcarpus 441 TaxID=765257 RepID=A0A0C9YHI9_9AGAM|nr:hypothetical protein BKA83DRAFT_16011 [Pisolithus microcarpus]KIK16131.1 hypothetical protein PISMIDRAFT_16011 [Pisolithus microcarpus 441]